MDMAKGSKNCIGKSRMCSDIQKNTQIKMSEPLEVSLPMDENVQQVTNYRNFVQMLLSDENCSLELIDEC
jgi:hypothetical protein